jgi:hypothetical protein
MTSRDHTDAYRAPIAWTRSAAERRRTCPCPAHRAIRCAERWPEHIGTIVPRVLDELTEKEAA